MNFVRLIKIEINFIVVTRQLLKVVVADTSYS